MRLNQHAVTLPVGVFRQPRRAGLTLMHPVNIISVRPSTLNIILGTT